MTTGSNWRFLRLTGMHLGVDVDEYLVSNPDRVLGVLLFCCGVTNPTA